MSVKKKVIFDVDTGIDDALAIAYATRSNELDLLGMTTCFGNVTVDVATRNTHYILDLLDVDIPVYKGSTGPLSGKELDLEVAKGVHGVDGLGNCFRDAAIEVSANNQDAVSFIIDSIKKNPHEITLLFVGPLTNLASVVRKAPEVIGLVKEVVIMGGAVTVPGNVKPYAEANIYSDPQAAEIVFQTGLPIKLVGLDVTMKTLLPRSAVKKWEKSESPISQFYAKMTTHYIGAYEKFQPGIKGCSLHDPLAVGIVLDPSFVQTKKMSVHVDTMGETVGKTYGSESTNDKNEIEVCLQVEHERFLSHFLNTLQFDE